MDAKANVEISDKCGDTALIYAARNSQTDIVKMFVEVEANVDIHSAYDETALITAAQTGRMEIVDVGCKYQCGYTEEWSNSIAQHGTVIWKW